MKRYSNELDLRRFFEASRRLWWIYAAAFVAVVAVIIWYAGRHMPEYEAEGIILIEDSEDSASSIPSGMESFARTFSMGGFGSSVDNEVLVIATNDMRSRVIRRLGLNITTVLNEPGGGRSLLFGNEPVLVKAPQEMLDSLTRSLKIKIALDHGKVTAKATKGLFAKTVGEVKNAAVPCVLNTPYGDFTIAPGPAYSPEEKADLSISVTGTNALAEAMVKKITVEIVDKTADAISIKYLDPNPIRAKAIINNMMAEYNNLRRDRKHAVARQEVAYYTDRVNELSGELNAQEKEIENFRTEKQAIAPHEEAAILMQTTFGDERQIKEAETKRTYYQQVLAAINSNSPDELIPTSESLGNPLIAEYNSTVMRRRRLERSATAENPAMKLIDNNLAEMRTSIRRNAESLLKQLDMELATSRRLTGKAESRLSNMPGIQRQLSDLNREQSITNQLYLALLNKKEEAELKVLTETDPGFIIEEAYADTKPSLKKIVIISAVLIFLGAFGSVALVLLWMRFTDRASTPKDLAMMGLESHTANVSTDPASLKKLRAILTESGTPQVLYTLDYSDNAEAMIGALVASMRAIDTSAAMMKARSTDNDWLLSTDFRNELTEECGTASHVFVETPDADNPDELIPILREENAGVLAFISSRAKRKAVKKLLGDISVEKLFVAIVDR